MRNLVLVLICVVLLGSVVAWSEEQPQPKQTLMQFNEAELARMSAIRQSLEVLRRDFCFMRDMKPSECGSIAETGVYKLEPMPPKAMPQPAK